MKTKYSRKMRKIKTRVQKSEVEHFDEVPFVVGIKHFFKRRVKKLSNDNEEYLRSTLTEFLRIFRSQLSDKTNQRIAVQVLLEVLYKKDIVDIPVVTRFMYVYQAVVKSYLGETFRYLYIWWTPRDEKVAKTADSFWDIQQKVIPYTRWYPKFFAHLTIDAVRYGRCDFLQFLLKRRLNIFPPQEVKPLIALANRFWVLEPNTEKRGTIRTAICDRYDSSELVRYISNGELFSYRRMFLIFLTIIITNDIASLNHRSRWLGRELEQQKSLISRHTRMAKMCLHLLTQSIPEPYVSVEDVRQFLKFFQSERDDAVEIACSYFQEVFSESPKFSSPRSLKDLCRCKIRESIKSEKPFPVMVARMDYYPLPLKKFILHHDPYFKHSKSYDPKFQALEHKIQISM